jgi:hypothetical protein
MTTIIRRDKFILTPTCPDGLTPMLGQGNVYYVSHHPSDAIRCYVRVYGNKYNMYTWCGRWALIGSDQRLPN